MKSGIYKITNKINGKIYIGSSVDLKRRINEHFWELKNNRHPNIHLQYAYNKYGRNNFEVEVIEYCNKNIVREREQYYIDKYLPYLQSVGYNISNNSNGGNTGNSETHPKAKLTWNDVKKMRNKYNQDKLSMNELSKLYGISIQAVRAIILNINWHDDSYVPPSKQELKYRMSFKGEDINKQIRNIRIDYINGASTKELSIKYQRSIITIRDFVSYRAHKNYDLDLKNACLSVKRLNKPIINASNSENNIQNRKKVV